ncbi:MAG: LTA synthase family protein [Heyndrickxia sp.]
MFRNNKADIYIYLPVVATFLLWFKTYIVYRAFFHFKTNNIIEEIILFINPIGFLMLLFGVCLFLKTGKSRSRYILLSSFFLSFILYANIVFYRFFNDFITIPILFQTNNFRELGDSVYTEIKWWDFIFFLDILLLYYFQKRKFSFSTIFHEKNVPHRRQYFFITCIIMILNLGFSEIERPQLLTRTFDRKLLVKNLGPYTYQLYDIILQSKSSAQKAFADETKLLDTQHFVRANDAPPNKRFYGLAKGRNLILVSMESTQDFVINSKIDGKEITPFLNQFIKDSYYFPNLYHQTGQGKTSDAEFIVENSLYPLNRGAVFFTHSGNTYDSMAKKLQAAGYYTAAMHANNKSFWNRNIMYKSIGYQNFFSSTSYSITPENSVGWGLKDIPFLEQSANLIKNLPNPYYVKLITLTNHHPFRLNEEDKFINEYHSNDPIVNRYFTTVRYEDEALKQFIQKLKEENLYNQSIIVLYGDHHGISENHHAAMSQYLGKEITPYESFNLQKVPLIIHIPGITNQGKGIIFSKVGGQIDIRPTILHLLGMETKEDVQFGHDLLSPFFKQYVIFRDGKFVTDQYLWTANTCYLRESGIEVDMQQCKPFIGQESRIFMYSDKIIYGDLLRFKNGRK